MNVTIQSHLLSEAHHDSCVAMFCDNEQVSCCSSEAAADFANMLDGCAFE